MNFKKKVAHKQSKFFTIMLIPDSSVKVKSMKIPHWVFHLVGGTMLIVVSIMVFSRVQAAYFKNLSASSSSKLEETLEENNKLLGEQNKLKSAFESEKKRLTSEKQSIEKKIGDFEDKVDEIQNQINEINSLKQEIYDKISEAESIQGGPNIVLDDYSDNPNPMGGPAEDATFGDYLSELEVTLGNNILELKALSKAVDDIQPFLDSYPKGLPVNGRITSEFGNRSNPFGGSSSESHRAMDIKASTGTRVAVTGGGTVSFAGEQGGYGNLVIVDHGYGYTTYYAHNSKLLVNSGDKVSRGAIISLSGNTGRSTGPHVHYEVRINGVPQNPRNFIPKE